VDTPGIHRQARRAMNRAMNRTAFRVLRDVDVVVFVVDRLSWTEEDEQVLAALEQVDAPVILAVNKVDLLSDKQALLPHLAAMAERFAFAEMVPIAALRNDQVAVLEQCVQARLPEGSFLFPEDQWTDRSERFLVAELIREKLMRQLGAEVPYRLAVEIERFEARARSTHIHAIVWVEKPGQKAMVIGQRGQRLRRVGEEARRDIEALLHGRVMLHLWVKVRGGWSDDERALRSLGLDEG
jgi:GTP-binding protein Era